MSAERAKANGELLCVRGLAVEYRGVRGEKREIVAGLDLDLAAGETVGIVGESGSGKSLSARAIVRLLPPGVHARGSIVYRGKELSDASNREMAAIRGSSISMLLQDPFTMLNPLLRSGKHIEECLAMATGSQRGNERLLRAEAARRLSEVGIADPDVLKRYPFQLSGGMRQRVALAAALARDPDILIADEPSTALDVTTQAEILRLLKHVQEARGMGLILITHDLRVAFTVCDRIYVLYAGALLETGPARALEAEPLHPYSLGLLLSEPAVDRKHETLTGIEGSVPAPDEVVGMCRFAPRCRWATDVCHAAEPSLHELEPSRKSACIRLDEIRGEMMATRTSARARAADSIVAASDIEPLVRIEQLRKVFADRSGGGQVHALGGVSIEVGRNESVGLVGESGSGKTTLGRCLVGLERATSGTVFVDGIDASDLGSLSRDDRVRVRQMVQIVFQDPYSSLDPMQTVGSALKEVLSFNGFPRDGADERVRELLTLVGLPAGYAGRRPAALSGGERQRVAIARTLAVSPQLVVCDEPVSSLDVSVQAQILNLFRTLRTEFGLSYLFISHDLAVIRQVVDRVYVLYRGEIVEQGPVDTVLDRPQHEYTAKLIASIPKSAVG
ncbi:MAG: dipeptide ABC transporter ATP-binding protein [Gaiellaceae bacterium]